MRQITSLQNPHVKAAVRLRDRRHRQKQGRLLIDGARELNRALTAGVPLVHVFVCEAFCRSEQSRAVLAAIRQSGATVYSVTETVFRKLAFGQRTDGVLAVGLAPAARLDQIRLPELPLVAVLEGVEKPGNIGAVLRSADAAGVSAVVVVDPRTDLFNPNTIRASLGTIFSLPVAVATVAEVLDWLRCRGLRIYAARVDAPMMYTQADFRGPTAIVLGSEAAGLSGAWRGSDIVAIRLPMRGMADSLNVSATAAVLFYEALRQRG